MTRRSTFHASTGVALSLAVVLAVSACGSKQEEPGAAEKSDSPKEPVTLLFYTDLTNEVFNQFWGDRLKAKFPHITVNHQQGTKGNTIQELVAQGNIPDVLRTMTTTIADGYLGLGLAYDHRELLKKHNYSLDPFDPVYIHKLINETKATGGEIYGLPINSPAPLVLFYNKELFNQFGVPYPTNGLYWDDIYEIAKKMSRTEGGKAYRGFSSNYVSVLRDNQLSVPILDSNADQMENADRWKPLFDNLLRFYEIPNNPIAASQVAELQTFYKDKNVAMMAGQIGDFLNFPADLNWDMVSLPQMRSKPATLSQLTPPFWSITKQSKHKDEALEVIRYLLSEEVQLEHSKMGRVTTLKSDVVKKAFGQDDPVLKDKNTSAVYYYKFADPLPARKADTTHVSLGVTQNLGVKIPFEKVVLGQADLNTALREAGEAIKQEIAKLKNQ